MFSNVLDNAIKNTPGGGQVVITAAEVGDFVETMVADDKPGIASDQLPHVFERFCQVTGLRTRVAEGWP